MEFGTMCRMVNLEQMPGFIVPVPLSLTDIQGGYLTDDSYRRVLWRHNPKTSSILKFLYWKHYNLPEVLSVLSVLGTCSIMNVIGWGFSLYMPLHVMISFPVVTVGWFSIIFGVIAVADSKWYDNIIKPMIIEFEHQQDEADPYFMHFTQQRSVQTVAPIFFYTLAALIADVSWSTYLVFICFMVTTIYIRLKFPTEQDKKRKEYYTALEMYIACHLGLMALKQEGFHMTTCPYPGCRNKHEY